MVDGVPMPVRADADAGRDDVSLAEANVLPSAADMAVILATGTGIERGAEAPEAQIRHAEARSAADGGVASDGHVTVPAQPQSPDDVAAWGSAVDAASAVLSSWFAGRPYRPTGPGPAFDGEGQASDQAATADLATWRRATSGDGGVVAAADGEPLRCGSAASAPDREYAVVPGGSEESDDADEEQADSRAGDLLAAESSLWGKAWSADPGVLR
jgi:hypothetical protein